MKWEEIKFEKLREGEVFRAERIPNRVYQVDETGKDVEGKPYLMASDLVRGAEDLCFSGGGEPYFRLCVPGAEVIDAIAERLTESQGALKQKTERFNELLQKWEAKRVEEQKDRWEDADWENIQVDDTVRWRWCSGEDDFHRSESCTVVAIRKDTMFVSDGGQWVKDLRRFQYQRLVKN
ncbi:hypothetical protein KAR91_04640 [Candidatus Pacearchaeota archaeon]|nr:hypothetical protein [Candidatus Pacearchaeota archaeon]